jgi:hypothetical protein
MEDLTKGTDSNVPQFAYFGIQHRKKAFPYLKVDVDPIDHPARFFEQYCYKKHLLTNANYNEMLKDALQHPVCGPFVRALVKQYSEKPLLCGFIAKTYKVPAKELNDWVWLLNKTGMIYVGMPEITDESEVKLKVAV